MKLCGPKVWNSIDESIKTLNIVTFKQRLKKQFIARIILHLGRGLHLPSAAVFLRFCCTF